MHSSIPLLDFPIELIEVTPINPLISKCQIKVCYVDDEPNRNKSVITKEVARKIANSLPGSPIVGLYKEDKKDFNEHDRVVTISNGAFEISDATRPYGFVDLAAKVWFQKYLDDGEVEREYLVTEGYLWTGQYPECERVITHGNNQSMELDTKTLDATWTKDINGKPKFFIINEAIISKLCILGEDVEPCFEGASISAPKVQFSFDEDFKEQLFSMMKELKDLINNEGGAKMFNRYAVDIGDGLWTALYTYLENNFPCGDDCCGSVYRIEGIYEENDQKFAVLQHRTDMKFYRLNFFLSETDGFSAADTLIEVTRTYVPSEEPQFSLEDVAAFEAKYAASKDKVEQVNTPETEVFVEDKKDEDDDEKEEKCPECGKPLDECTCDEEEEEDKKEYSLDEIPEYCELQTKYSELETEHATLRANFEELEAQVSALKEFKASIEKKEKKAMIDSFTVLTEEDKKDVIDNIDTYSLEEIESKLSVICVRNKVNFNLDDDNSQKQETVTVYKVDETNDDCVPAWVKRAMSVAKTLQ